MSPEEIYSDITSELRRMGFARYGSGDVPSGLAASVGLQGPTPLEALIAAVERLLEVAPAFRLKRIGAPYSDARQQQALHVAAEDEVRDAIARAKCQ